MNVKSIQDITVPTPLVGSKSFASEDELLQWENELIAFFSSQYELFTPYPEYFRLRCYEFRILRQLLPELSGFNHIFERGLEIGCGYGFKTLLLSRMCKSFLGIDIPEKYKGYVRGDYSSSVEIAKIIVNDKFQINNVTFECAWPDNMLNVDSDSISFLFSEYCLEHIPKLSKAISEMYRVLRKDGVMIHVVPNTKDAVIQFVKAQLNTSAGRLIKELVKKVLGGGNTHIKLNGIVIPPCHSEFISDYSEQIDIYSLENYLFPMLDAGFRIERIVSTREHNDVIVARK